MSRWMRGFRHGEQTDHIGHLLSDYIDGCLTPRIVRRVEAHLARCSACARELEEWRSLLKLVSRHATIQCPIDCADLVLQRLAGEPAGPGADRSLIRPSRFMAFLPTHPARWAATVLLLAALLSGWTWVQSSRSPRAPVATVRNGGTASPLPPTALQGQAPERLDGAFGRSDSLILASDFAAEE